MCLGMATGVRPSDGDRYILHYYGKDYDYVLKDTPGGIGRLIKQIGEQAGVENCHAHRFRRTCATTALNKGMPMEQVSKMLGHETLDTTQIYAESTEENLRYSHKRFIG